MPLQNLTLLLRTHPDDISAYEALSRLCEQRPGEFDKDAGDTGWMRRCNRNPSSAMAYIVRGAFEVRGKKIRQGRRGF